MGTASTLLANHVTLRVRSVDRLWIAGYIRALTNEGGVVSFLLHRASLIGTRNIPSPALFANNHDRMAADFGRLVEHLDLPLLRFKGKESTEPVGEPGLVDLVCSHSLHGLCSASSTSGGSGDHTIPLRPRKRTSAAHAARLFPSGRGRFHARRQVSTAALSMTSG